MGIERALPFSGRIDQIRAIRIQQLTCNTDPSLGEMVWQVIGGYRGMRELKAEARELLKLSQTAGIPISRESYTGMKVSARLCLLESVYRLFRPKLPRQAILGFAYHFSRIFECGDIIFNNVDSNEADDVL